MYDIWDYYLSSPIVDNNILYVGSSDSCIYALNIGTGKKLWSYKTNGVVHATPVIKDGVVFIGSYDGSFYALQSTTGKLIWKFKQLATCSSLRERSKKQR